MNANHEWGGEPTLAANLCNTTAPMKISDLYAEFEHYISALRLFSAHFHDAPNSLTVSSINSAKAKKHFIEAFGSRIWNHYFF
jgi:hypothetical protein